MDGIVILGTGSGTGAGCEAGIRGAVRGLANGVTGVCLRGGAGPAERMGRLRAEGDCLSSSGGGRFLILGGDDSTLANRF